MSHMNRLISPHLPESMVDEYCYNEKQLGDLRNTGVECQNVRAFPPDRLRTRRHRLIFHTSQDKTCILDTETTKAAADVTQL